MSEGKALRPVRVWDLPTRLFHWLLAACVIGSVLSAKLGGNAMVWHMRLGYAVLALIAFRLLWGLVGGRWSRFAQFVPGPGRLWRYLRGRSRPADFAEVGHNPLGALSVLAMLGWLLLQVGSGLIADDEIAITGPLVRFVSLDTSLAWTSHHKSWGQWGLYLLLGLHLLALLYYGLVRRRNLPAAMWHGDKTLAPAVPAARDGAATRLLALALLAACAAGVAWLVSLGAA
ncbi:cytochrome B [Roseateles sp. DAIF2]|uniref:cytochrome b/b6 domain-containing protein n=1 Tax=Roseateles sp. DAIF2 TaxID=2714952 RepID=UPI0018A2954D|nr:cytochrome b/b6 domain-containing protein [Roseateles sp. DAIF2]QPF72007.1 cytochrome B [Roseateles sp. DAIF2]